MGKKIVFFICAVLTFCSLSVFALAPSDPKGIDRPSEGGAALKNIPTAEPRSVLTIMPREVDLGSIQPNSTAFGEFKLSDLTPGAADCAASCPDGWEAAAGKALPVKVSHEPFSLRVELTVSETPDKARIDKSKDPIYAAKMKMEAAGKELICQKNLKAGRHRKEIGLTFAGGRRTVFVEFRIQPAQGVPSIHLYPQRLDLGIQTPGKILSKKIELTNRSREKLQWSVVGPAENKATALPMESKQERYFSFRNEEPPEPGKYLVPEHLKDAMELFGKWTERNGYPLIKSGAGSLKYRFQGTGISLFLQSHTPDGNCSVYLDEAPVNLPEELSGEWEKKEILIAEGLADGFHTLNLLIKGGNLEMEGVKVFGREAQRGPRGWITVFPNSGTTLSEIDYLHVKVDTTSLTPGIYGDDILFQTNAGEAAAEVYVNIVPDTGQKVLDVYLYTNDFDFLYTSDPQSEARRLYQNRYIKEGIAFRLFAPQTPGTTAFHRWYNPVIKDHFYAYERTGGGKRLEGYLYEGTIGNIATSRMTNTRELYRWYNPSTGRHYYSTHTKLPPTLKKYRFDGIAGYVR